MAEQPAKRPRLRDRDYEIFEHILRYRLTTREILHKLFFADSDLNAVTKVTSRLVTHGFLNRYDLYPPRTYFVFGPQGAPLFGMSERRTKHYGPQALIREYGTLAYCCGTDEQRKRLTVQQIRERSPHLLQKKLDSSHYYLDDDGQTTRLGHIRVHAAGEPDHVVRKCRRDLELRYRYPAFRKLIDDGRFRIAIVVATEPFKDAIHLALRRHHWPDDFRFRIEVVPELIHLIPRQPNAQTLDH